MKNKIISIVIVLTLITPIVLSAGNSKTLYFNKDDEKIYYHFPLKDKVEFELLNETQVIIMDDIYMEKGVVGLDLFPNGGEGVYVPLVKGKYVSLDLNKDKKEDMQVKLIAIDNETQANILFHKIGQNTVSDSEDNETLETNNTDLEPITGGVTGPKTEKTPNYIIGITISLVIIIGLLVVRQVYNSKKEKKE